MEILTSRKLCENIQHAKRWYGTEKCDRVCTMFAQMAENGDLACFENLYTLRNPCSQRFDTLYPIVPDSQDKLNVLFEVTEQRIDALVPLKSIQYDEYTKMYGWCDVGGEQTGGYCDMLVLNGVPIRRFRTSDYEIVRGLRRCDTNTEDGRNITWRNIELTRESGWTLPLLGELRDSCGPFRLFYIVPNRFVTVYNMDTDQQRRYSLEKWGTPDKNGIVHDHDFSVTNMNLRLLHTGEPYASNPHVCRVRCLGSNEEFCLETMSDEVAFDDNHVFLSKKSSSEITVVDRMSKELKGKFYKKFTEGECAPTRYRNGILSCDLECREYHLWKRSHSERRWNVDASNIKRALYLYRARPRGLPSELVKRVASYLCYALK